MPRRMRIMVEERTEQGGALPRRVHMERVPGRELLPELAPADPPAGAVAAAPATETLRDLPPEEARLARVTVYALNAIVMVFAMPVGAALLVINVLKGEDLRATAHGLALTGAYLGLMSTPQGAAFFAGLL